MFPSNMTLPDYAMIAGESQNITLYLFAKNNKQIDAAGMTGRLAISDYVNQNSEPYVIKVCSIATPEGEDLATVNAALSPSDTVDLCGKYIYQFTIKDTDGTVAILKGFMEIGANNDKGALI